VYRWWIKYLCLEKKFHFFFHNSEGIWVDKTGLLGEMCIFCRTGHCHIPFGYTTGIWVHSWYTDIKILYIWVGKLGDKKHCVWWFSVDTCRSEKELLYNIYIYIYIYISVSENLSGAPEGAFGWGTVLQAGMSLVRFLMVSEFFIDITLPAMLWPWNRLSLKQKWVPRIFPVG